MNLFQIIALFFIFIFVILEILKLRNQPVLKVFYGIRWLVVSGVAFLVIAEPNISATVAKIFGITRGADFVIYISILWLLFKSYSDSKKISKLETTLETLVRRITLQQESKDDQK